MSITHLKSLSQLNTIFAEGKPSVIDFHASWCAPCHSIAPSFEGYATQFPNVKFLKCDVDAVAEIAQKYSVSAMPTFMFFNGANKVEQVRGADKSALLAALKRLSSGGSTGSSGAFSGKGQTLTGAGGSAIGAEGLSSLAAGLDPQLKVLLGLVGAYAVFWYFS